MVQDRHHISVPNPLLRVQDIQNLAWGGCCRFRMMGFDQRSRHTRISSDISPTTMIHYHKPIVDISNRMNRDPKPISLRNLEVSEIWHLGGSWETNIVSFFDTEEPWKAHKTHACGCLLTISKPMTCVDCSRVSFLHQPPFGNYEKSPLRAGIDCSNVRGQQGWTKFHNRTEKTDSAISIAHIPVPVPTSSILVSEFGVIGSLIGAICNLWNAAVNRLCAISSLSISF